VPEKPKHVTPGSISVTIPAHNAEAFLREAIESVLQQSIPLELVVVNDGSTDATASIIASYGDRVRALHQGQCGLGAARNRGVRATRSEWIAFLDADDRWTPDKLCRQAAVLAARSDIDMVFGHCVEFTNSSSDGHWIARTEPFPAHSACAMLARRACFDRIGGFSESGKVGEFIDWYSRARDSGAAEAMLADVVFHRRVHGSNMTRVTSDKRGQYLDVVFAHLQRRRTRD
jgi:glycosyltransferase involved in cell wall biosynthesis